jgi:antitoxin VapB
MRTVSIFTNGNNQAVRIPKDMQFSDVSKLEIMREGDTLILRPVRPDWLSFAEVEKADDDFLIERPDVVVDEGRFECE